MNLTDDYKPLKRNITSKVDILWLYESVRVTCEVLHITQQN